MPTNRQARQSVVLSGQNGLDEKKAPFGALFSDQLARPERFERPTLWFVARYSIQLSYGCAVNTTVLWRRKRDSNPRYRFKPVCFLSREVPSTTRPFLRFERGELYAHSPPTSTTQTQLFRINFVLGLNQRLYATRAQPIRGIFHQSKQRL